MGAELDRRRRFQRESALTEPSSQNQTTTTSLSSSECEIVMRRALSSTPVSLRPTRHMATRIARAYRVGAARSASGYPALCRSSRRTIARPMTANSTSAAPVYHAPTLKLLEKYMAMTSPPPTMTADNAANSRIP
jgi:hypothetical protein